MIEGDLHIHSIYSNGYFKNFPPWVASTPAEILAKARKFGLKVVAIADHDSLKGSQEAEKLAKEFDMIVIPACEITTYDGHILAYGIKKEIPKKLSAQETIGMIHDQGGLAVAAHPFRVRPPIFNGIGLNELIYQLPLDGLEVANAGVSLKVNTKALVTIQAKSLKMAKIGGSDSHVLDFIGFGRTIFKDKVKTTKDALEAIRERQTETKIISYEPMRKMCLFSARDQFKFLLNLA